MADWKVERGTRRCAVSERPFEPGETYYSALLEDEEGFRRQDFCAAAWQEQDPAAFFSFWKTRLPEEGEEERPQRRFIDTDVIYTFFTRLRDAASEEKQTFRYLLALILIRKRYLRLEEFTRGADGREYLVVHDRRAEETLHILNPEATREALAAAQQELSCIFDMDFEDEGPAPAAGEEQGDGAPAAAPDDAETESAPAAETDTDADPAPASAPPREE
jgi:hypothetical protein